MDREHLRRRDAHRLVAAVRAARRGRRAADRATAPARRPRSSTSPPSRCGRAPPPARACARRQHRVGRGGGGDGDVVLPPRRRTAAATAPAPTARPSPSRWMTRCARPCASRRTAEACLSLRFFFTARLAHATLAQRLANQAAVRRRDPAAAPARWPPHRSRGGRAARVRQPDADVRAHPLSDDLSWRVSRRLAGASIVTTWLIARDRVDGGIRCRRAGRRRPLTLADWRHGAAPGVYDRRRCGCAACASRFTAVCRARTTSSSSATPLRRSSPTSPAGSPSAVTSSCSAPCGPRGIATIMNSTPAGAASASTVWSDGFDAGAKVATAHPARAGRRWRARRPSSLRRRLVARLRRRALVRRAAHRPADSAACPCAAACGAPVAVASFVGWSATRRCPRPAPSRPSAASCRFPPPPSSPRFASKSAISLPFSISTPRTFMCFGPVKAPPPCALDLRDLDGQIATRLLGQRGRGLDQRDAPVRANDRPRQLVAQLGALLADVRRNVGGRAERRVLQHANHPNL